MLHVLSRRWNNTLEKGGRGRGTPILPTTMHLMFLMLQQRIAPSSINRIKRKEKKQERVVRWSLELMQQKKSTLHLILLKYWECFERTKTGNAVLQPSACREEKRDHPWATLSGVRRTFVLTEFIRNVFAPDLVVNDSSRCRSSSDPHPPPPAQTSCPIA